MGVVEARQRFGLVGGDDDRDAIQPQAVPQRDPHQLVILDRQHVVVGQGQGALWRSMRPPMPDQLPQIVEACRIGWLLGVAGPALGELIRNLEQNEAAAEDAVHIAAFNRILRAYSREADPTG